MQRDPGAVDALFTSADGGVGKLTVDLVTSFTSASSGLITLKSKNLTTRIEDLEEEIAERTLRVANFEEELTAQFAAVQSVLSNYQSISDYLTLLSQANDD